MTPGISRESTRNGIGGESIRLIQSSSITNSKRLTWWRFVRELSEMAK